jgi:hypothetical protein
MKILFQPLFTLAVNHAYYGGPCRDLGFVFPQETERLLRGARLVTKVLDGRLHVLFEADEEGAPLVSAAGRTLRIGLQLLNPSFPNFSALPIDPATAVALYANAGDPRQLDAPQPVAAADLADPELARQGVFGVVEARIDAGLYSEPAAFEIAFDAREETLRYYLVVRRYSAAELEQLSVSDAGFTEEARPEVRFTKVPAAAFTAAEIPPALLGGSDATVVLFRSQAPVARRQRGRRKIQLSRNGEVLIEHLPQPGAERATADLIVHLSKP